MVLDISFFSLEPDQLTSLDLTMLAEDELKELSYFTWTMYPDDTDLMSWRESKLLPLIRIDNLDEEEDEDDEDIE